MKEIRDSRNHRSGTQHEGATQWNTHAIRVLSKIGRRYPVLTAWLMFLGMDLSARFRGFGAVYGFVRNWPTPSGRIMPSQIEAIASAVDKASVFYLHRILCLQRSIATALLLRAHGFPAHVVIGFRAFPSSGHAWVEVQGSVVGGHQILRQRYREIDRL
ncbi:MAG: lasso peptide biosynthesis B2 protein [Candidatus Acidiferrales bacterium]